MFLKMPLTLAIVCKLTRHAEFVSCRLKIVAIDDLGKS